MRQSIPAYVIDLDRRTDRWETISANLDRIGVTAERIPAVDARALSDEVRRGRPLGRIDLGSASNMMGHARAMQRLLDSDAPAALILEDDAELSRDTAKLLRSTGWWPEEAKVVRLEDVRRGSRLLWRPAGTTPDGRELRRAEKWIGGTAAYLVNREGARIALKAFADPGHTTDHTLFDLRVSRTARRLRPYRVVPPIARQGDGKTSDIRPWRNRWRPRRRLKQQLFSLPYRIRSGIPMAVGRVRRVELTFRDRMG